jgi:G3E family GTPase
MTATSPAKIPVTVVGGFLGAGKTTFLNHLLKTSDARYAVLVNDFGAVNIDASLIAQHDGATMTLTNGCVCCSIGGGFIETLGKILDDGIPFDHIIIEASGVGDPWRIAEIALVEPSLRLNAVIVLADASRIETLLVDARVGDTVRNQFARADLVLLNKIDLLDRASARAAYAAISALRDGLHIIETSEHTMPDLPAGAPKTVSRFSATEALDVADHERLFRRWSYQRNGAFDRVRLEAALEQLPPQLLRLKGHCLLVGETEPAVLQMVGQDWALTAAATSDLPDQPGILLVGVGTDDLPDTAELDTILDRALASISDAPSIHITNDNGGLQPSTTRFHSLREGQSRCL